MSYAILRAEKLKSIDDIRRLLMHTLREQETPNADPCRIPDNKVLVGETVKDALAKVGELLPVKHRANAVLSVEYLITASPEAMRAKTVAEQDAYLHDALAWLQLRHGIQNVYCASIHRDEVTPHMHAFVVPIDERGNLNCRAFLGGAGTLAQMQTDFAQKVGQTHQFRRGNEQSKATHIKIREYYTRVNSAFSPLPTVKTEPAILRPVPDAPGWFASKGTKQKYRRDQESWEAERLAVEAQNQQRQMEIAAQTKEAVETAKRHQAMASEAAVLRASLVEQKRAANRYAAKVAKLETELAEKESIAALFSPDEVQAAVLRKQRQCHLPSYAHEAHQTEPSELEVSLTTEKIVVERQRRIAAIDAMTIVDQTPEGIFVAMARRAIRAAGSPDRVQWSLIEGAAAVEAIREQGHSPRATEEALIALSPGRADPRNHIQVHEWFQRYAAQLQEQRSQFRSPRAGNLDQHQ